MRPLRRSLFSFFGLSIPCFALAARESWLDCAYYPDKQARCNEPMDPVTVVTPGSFYIAKMACLGCPVVGTTGAGANRKHFITEDKENDLFFNISLSHDGTTLLLTSSSFDTPIFPHLLPSDFAAREPPRFHVARIAPNFSRADLDTSLACPKDERCQTYMGKTQCWCLRPTLDSVRLDYDYGARELEKDEEQGTAKWEVTLDAIGGQDGYQDDPVWSFNHTDQRMLRIVVRGKEVERKHGKPHAPNGSPFGTIGNLDPEPVYKLDILDVELVDRTYPFPDRTIRGFWARLKHFFGSDPSPPPGHIIYLQEEWGDYGKYGTLRNEMGKIIYDWWWDLIFIIVGSIVGGLVVLYGLYRLFLVILEQRRLAQWGGMDEVWRQIREGGDEDEGLLESGYRDEPDTPPPRYTDELPVNKPLPPKPLPDKPLPAVPLIEDV